MTASYHLTKNGHEICVYDFPKFDTQIKAINENGGIKALEKDHKTDMILGGFSKISIATTNIKEDMDFSDIFIMICPSFAQELLFQEMLPHLRNGMKIILMPRNYVDLLLW